LKKHDLRGRILVKTLPSLLRKDDHHAKDENLSRHLGYQSP